MAAADTHYGTPYGSFELQRYPARRAEPLQAWCNADSLLLDEIHSRSIPGDSILVVNDEQGALCVALQPLALWTDSALSALALHIFTSWLIAYWVDLPFLRLGAFFDASLTTSTKSA